MTKLDDKIEDIALLPVHFDVPEHYFEAKDYFTLLKSFDDSLSELNKRLFNGELDCKLLVLRNEDGTFKTFLAIVATIWTVYSIVFTQYLNLMEQLLKKFLNGCKVV